MPRWIVACGAVSLHAQLGALAHQGQEQRPRTPMLHSCSRAVSRAVRKELEKEVLKPAAREGIESWPERCPFDTALDLYGVQEGKKQRNRPGHGSGTWTCNICGKSFKNEYYLDLHMENRHMNETPRHGVCLADYCEVFEVCTSEQKWRTPKVPAVCDPAALKRARGLCEESLRACFPLDLEVPRRQYAKLSRQFCQVLDCSIREERQKELDGMPVPVIVLLILVVLIAFILFSVVVCCVDYSEDIAHFLVESRLASRDTVHRWLQTRERARQAVGTSRTKSI